MKFPPRGDEDLDDESSNLNIDELFSQPSPVPKTFSWFGGKPDKKSFGMRKFGYSESHRVTKLPDGTVKMETIKRDSDGNEECKTVYQKGGEVRTVVKKRDKRGKETISEQVGKGDHFSEAGNDLTVEFNLPSENEGFFDIPNNQDIFRNGDSINALNEQMEEVMKNFGNFATGAENFQKFLENLEKNRPRHLDKYNGRKSRKNFSNNFQIPKKNAVSKPLEANKDTMFKFFDDIAKREIRQEDTPFDRFLDKVDRKKKEKARVYSAFLASQSIDQLNKGTIDEDSYKFVMGD